MYFEIKSTFCECDLFSHMLYKVQRVWSHSYNFIHSNFPFPLHHPHCWSQSNILMLVFPHITLSSAGLLFLCFSSSQPFLFWFPQFVLHDCYQIFCISWPVLACYLYKTLCRLLYLLPPSFFIFCYFLCQFLVPQISLRPDSGPPALLSYDTRGLAAVCRVWSQNAEYRSRG